MLNFRFGPALDQGTPDNPTRSQAIFVDGAAVAIITLRQIPDGWVSPEPNQPAFCIETEPVNPKAGTAAPSPVRKKKVH